MADTPRTAEITPTVAAVSMAAVARTEAVYSTEVVAARTMEAAALAADFRARPGTLAV